MKNFAQQLLFFAVFAMVIVQFAEQFGKSAVYLICAVAMFISFAMQFYSWSRRRKASRKQVNFNG